MSIFKCYAPDYGDMDFCLQCSSYFDCELREMALQKTNDSSVEVQNE